MRYFGLVVRISRWAQYIILHTRHKKVLPFAFLVHLSVIYATHTGPSCGYVAAQAFMACHKASQLPTPDELAEMLADIQDESDVVVSMNNRIDQQ